MKKEDALKVLGSNIKYYREKRGLTLEQLAIKVGYDSKQSRSTIAKIEAGKSDIPTSRLMDFAKALNVKTTDLINENAIGQDVFQKFNLLNAHDQETIIKMIDVLLLQEGTEQETPAARRKAV